MAKGIGSFQGTRLSQVRQARGLSGVNLAGIVSVSPSTISQYEGDDTKPTSEMLDKLAIALNVPKTFFLRPIPNSSPSRFFYRSLHSATKQARTRAESRSEWLREIALHFEAVFDLPPVNVPKFDVPDFHEITNEMIESWAGECRKAWNVGDGPVPNMIRLLEKNGFIVGYFCLEADALDALSEWDGSARPFVILGTDKHSCARSRFNAAHELGHCILHSGVERRHIQNVKEHSTLERQAHRFASAFLLPEKEFTNEVVMPSLDSFAAMKERWKVAVAAMVMRSRDLGLLREEQEQRLWVNLARRGWRKKEPLDDSIPLEEPKLIRECIDMMLRSNFRSRAQIAEDLCLYSEDVEELVGLPSGYLTDGFGEIIEMPQFKNTPSKPEGAQSPSDLIPFKIS